MTTVTKSIRVDDDLWYKLKLYCAKNKVDMSEVITQLLENLVKGGLK